LKPECDETLSNIALNCNRRHYVKDDDLLGVKSPGLRVLHAGGGITEDEAAALVFGDLKFATVGRCRLTLWNLALTPHWPRLVSTPTCLNRKYDGPLSNFACFAFKCNLRHYTTASFALVFLCMLGYTRSLWTTVHGWAVQL